jgi:hypothetical protein
MDGAGFMFKAMMLKFSNLKCSVLTWRSPAFELHLEFAVTG